MIIVTVNKHNIDRVARDLGVGVFDLVHILEGLKEKGMPPTLELNTWYKRLAPMRSMNMFGNPGAHISLKE